MKNCIRVISRVASLLIAASAASPSVFPSIVLSVGMTGAALADTSNAPDCSKQGIVFDGISDLQYATVNGVAGDRIPLNFRYPSSSRSIAGRRDRNMAYVVPGDAVAVGGTCNEWSYVQNIGERTVTRGWIESARLTPLALSLPFDEGVPGGQNPTQYPAKWQIRVALREGRGVPVCEAYLQRLNQTFFYEPPFCGRPGNDQIPGFQRLHAIPLTASEVNRLAVEITNLQLHPTGHLQQKADAVALADAATGMSKIYLDTRKIVPAVPRGANVAVWRYDPQVDIDNDGSPDNLIMFSGFTWEKCGESTPQFPNGASAVPKPLVLSVNNSGIDVKRTEALFAAPWQVDGIDMGTAGRLPGYYPIGYSISLFEYRSTYYFDAFMGEVGDSTDSRDLHVFRRTKDRLEQVCRLENLDSKWRLR